MNLEGKHELHGTVVYVECILHEDIDPDCSVYGVLSNDYPFEHTLLGKNLLMLDDYDDYVIESYMGW